VKPAAKCRFQLVCCAVSYCNTGAYHKDAGKASWFVNRSRTPRMHYRVHQYKGIVSAESGGKEPAGFALVSEKVQVVRAEFLQKLLRAGIEINKTNKIRGWLERHMGVPLLDADKLVKQ
jgi:hypothetical protein